MTYICSLQSTGCKSTVVVLIDVICFQRPSEIEKRVFDDSSANLIKYGRITLFTNCEPYK